MARFEIGVAALAIWAFSAAASAQSWPAKPLHVVVPFTPGSAQRDRERQHPLAHLHSGNDVIDQPGGNARTTGPRHRNPAGGSERNVRSTA